MATMPRAFRNIKRVIEFEAVRFENQQRAVRERNARIEAELAEGDTAEAYSVSEMTREMVEEDFFRSRS